MVNQRAFRIKRRKDCGYHRSLWIGLWSMGLLTYLSLLGGAYAEAPFNKSERIYLAKGKPKAKETPLPDSAQGLDKEGEPLTKLGAELFQSLQKAWQGARLSGNAVGVYVQAVDDAKPLLAHNAHQLFAPASTMKLVTAYAALDLLGPQYTWKTGVYGYGRMQGDVWEGQIILRGSGDPSLTEERIWLGLKGLRQRGIRDIQGDIILDRRVFQLPGYDAGAFDGEPLRIYNAGANGLLFNYHALALSMIPEETGGSVRLSIDPELSGITVYNRLNIVRGACPESLHYAIKVQMDTEALSVQGNYPASCGAKTIWVHAAPWSDNQYAEQILRSTWQNLGGVWRGRAISGEVPAGAQKWYDIESEPLPEVVRRMNKFSNNVMARQVLLSLFDDGDLPATPARTVALVYEWAKMKGLPREGLIIDNGSGLSRSERVSPFWMGALLLHAWRSPLMADLMASLPMLGVDGTMRRRLVRSSAVGQAHIKTGAIDQVRSIAGYILSASGRRYVVVCIINHPQVQGARVVEDKLLEWLYQRG